MERLRPEKLLSFLGAKTQWILSRRPQEVFDEIASSGLKGSNKEAVVADDSSEVENAKNLKREQKRKDLLDRIAKAKNPPLPLNFSDIEWTPVNKQRMRADGSNFVLSTDDCLFSILHGSLVLARYPTLAPPHYDTRLNGALFATAEEIEENSVPLFPPYPRVGELDACEMFEHALLTGTPFQLMEVESKEKMDLRESWAKKADEKEEVDPRPWMVELEDDETPIPQQKILTAKKGAAARESETEKKGRGGNNGTRSGSELREEEER